MRRRSLVVFVSMLVLISLMLEACVQVTVKMPPSETHEKTESSDDEEPFTGGGKPWIDSDIKSNVTEDTVTDPRDDFHLYANKEWILENTIPEGRLSWSHYSERDYEVKNQCMELLRDESLEGHDADLVRTLNTLFLDWESRNSSGVSEIEDIYAKLVALRNIEDLNNLYEDKDILHEISTLFEFNAESGYNDPELYLVVIGTLEPLLNDSAEYISRSEYGEKYYGYWKDVFTHMAQRLGMSAGEAGECFDAAISFETMLADHIYTTEERNSEDIIERENNEMSLEELTDHCSSFPLGRILDTAGYSYDGPYLVTRPDYFDRLDELYTDANFEEIKGYLIVKYVLSFTSNTVRDPQDTDMRVDILDREIYDYVNGSRSRYFGVTGEVSDEEKAYNAVSILLPTSMQKVYIEKYGSAEDKERMEGLCRQVIETYREMLSENEWASDEVKETAIRKLDNMTIHAAYPEKFRDTSGIDIGGCSLIEAKRRIRRSWWDYNRSLIGTKKNKDMWAENFDILVCNAFYDPGVNTINMIIGMMGEPFYSDDMSTEELYASIGAFWVGHEISHAFDSYGSQFNENGEYENWWPDRDAEEFTRRVRKMDDYLDGIVAFGDEHLKGPNIDTEMVADMTGLQCALKMASKVKDFDYDKFFVKYAQMNVSLYLYSQELSNIRQDMHPLDYSRTNVPVQQFDEFYETYDVKEGDNMYLAPEDRLLVW